MSETPVEKKDIREIMKNINKKIGAETINFGNTIKTRERLKFKQDYLNQLTGGGIPYGLFTTFWGGESGGKSSIILDLIANAQADNKTCVYIDLEHSFDPDWAEKHGVDLEKLVYAGGFTYAEQSMDALIEFCKSQAADVIIVDSIHGMSPKAEQEEKSGKDKSMEDDSMALVARKLSQFFRTVAGHVSKANTAVILIGQTRTDLGAFIKLEKLSGGHALLHWSSLIMQIRRGQKADAPTKKIVNEEGKKVDVIVGFSSVIKITKSKIGGGCEGNETALPFYFGHGLTNGEAPVETLTETEDKQIMVTKKFKKTKKNEVDDGK